MNNKFAIIMETLNTHSFNENELNKIINICNKKIKETTDEHYKNEIYKIINNNIIDSFKCFHFYEKTFDSIHSYNIRFKYEYFNVTLSYKVSYCPEFGGISKDTTINIVDTHQETCYNLFGVNMISRFINILNLDINEDDINNILTLMFKAYQPEENIKW